jgi:hypothetical protein
MAWSRRFAAALAASQTEYQPDWYDGSHPVIERGNFHFYFPIATCILVSAVLSFIVWLLNR